jgi:hypothetical protein
VSGRLAEFAKHVGLAPETAGASVDTAGSRRVARLGLPLGPLSDGGVDGSLRCALACAADSGERTLDIVLGWLTDGGAGGRSRCTLGGAADSEERSAGLPLAPLTDGVLGGRSGKGVAGAAGDEDALAAAWRPVRAARRLCRRSSFFMSRSNFCSNFVLAW